MSKTTCSRGHVYNKAKESPVCPVCWPGKYAKSNDLPNLSAPATRALLFAKITTLAKLSTKTEKEVRALHGMGPASIPLLRSALKKKKLSFKK